MTTKKAARVTGVDTHAHIFSRALPMAKGRRYSPGYDAWPAEYIAHLDAHGLSHGVLVQPSFLGVDNSFIEEAILTYPTRLRGVAVVRHDVSERELDRLAAAGFAGFRLNLVGRDLDDYQTPEWQLFFQRIASRGLQLEIQRRFEDFGRILPAMMASGVNIVIDHFGLPTGGIDPAKPEHAALLDLLPSMQIWLKVSAIYRAPMTPAQAVASLEVLRNAAGGIDRLVWGSDWPHTQHEQQINYGAQFQMLETLFPDPAERQQVLASNAARLFGI